MQCKRETVSNTVPSLLAKHCYSDSSTSSGLCLSPPVSRIPPALKAELPGLIFNLRVRVDAVA
eukprot:1401511-Pleurochrysis_carterae.AAC.2